MLTYHTREFAWSTKRQSAMAASSVEAEYIARAKCVGQGLWVCKLKHDFKIITKTQKIGAGNKGEIAMSKDWKVNNTSKHIATAWHMQRDYIGQRMVSISYVSIHGTYLTIRLIVACSISS